jgi:hypothetical protein
MQQVTREQHPTVEPPGADLPDGDLPGRDQSGAAQLNPFVINLCSSTSPVALTPPDHAGLKRFTFFVSRRREESRERFRLHMGYFDTQEEAERLLDIVREIYPGAWAGLAPGQRLRAAAAQQQQALAQSARVAEVTPAPLEPLPGLDDAPISSAHISLLLESPQIPAQPQAHEPAPEPAPAPALSLASLLQPLLEPSPAPPPELLQDTLPQPVPTLAPAPHSDELTLLPDEGRQLPAAAAPKNDDSAATRSLLEVRAAIAALDDAGEQPPVLQPIPELKAPLHASHVGADPISDAVALALLESGRHEIVGAVGVADAAHADSAARPEKPCYAVQLMWSVQPLDVAKVPQLAIFSAYTLYGAEGNRDGRRWYGLRLGFFTDAVSAKQVAHYVRSEFSTVSVVPVTARERERAKLAAQRSPGSARTSAVSADIVLATAPGAKFDFIDDSATPLAPKAGGARSLRGAPGKRARLRPPSGSVKGNARVKPMTLEETLEILGAGELRVDNSRGPLINQPGAAHTEAKPGGSKASRLGRLFDRLAERLGS